MSRKKRQQNKNIRKQAIPHYTLIGEGFEEQYYFKHLNKFGKTSVKVQNSNCNIGGNIKTIEKKITEILNDHGRVVCVFDDDVEKVREYLNTHKNNPDVLICNSNPSIAYWFLLHYEKKYGAMTAENAFKSLQKHIKNYDKTEQFLQNEKWVADMLPHLDLACQRAKDNTNQPSYSNVYKIFEQQ